MTQSHPVQSTELLAQLERTEGYLQADPGNTDLLARAIDLCMDMGQNERAQRHVDAALAQHPADPFFRYRAAHVLSAQRRWSEAAPLLADLAAQHSDLNIAYSLANCLIQLGRHGAAWEALAAYRDAATLPGHVATLMVRALHHLGETELADALIERHRVQLAGDPVFLGAASLLCLDEGRLDDASALSAAALAGGKRPLEALVVSASLALAQTDADSAIAQFNEVLAVNPQEGRSWSGLGIASLLRRDLTGAVAQLEQAVQLMPLHIGSWHALGWSHLLAQNLDAAEAVFAHALALDRNFGDSHGGVAAVAAVKGQREVAEAAIARALGLDGESLSARYAQLVLAGHTRDPEQFTRMALRLLGARKSAMGVNLAELVLRHAGT